MGPVNSRPKPDSAQGPRGRAKTLYGPRTQANGETKYLDIKKKRGGLNFVRGATWNAPAFSRIRGLFIWQVVCPRMVISHTASSLRFSPRLVPGKYYFLRVGLIGLSTTIKAMTTPFYRQVFWS